MLLVISGDMVLTLDESMMSENGFPDLIKYSRASVNWVLKKSALGASGS